MPLIMVRLIMWAKFIQISLRTPYKSLRQNRRQRFVTNHARCQLALLDPDPGPGTGRTVLYLAGSPRLVSLARSREMLARGAPAVSEGSRIIRSPEAEAFLKEAEA